MALELRRSVNSIQSYESIEYKEESEEDDNLDILNCIIKQITKRKKKRRTTLSKRPTGRISLGINKENLTVNTSNFMPCETEMNLGF